MTIGVRRHYAQLSWKQALAARPSLPEDSKRLNRLWEFCRISPSRADEWREALTDFVCHEYGPVLIKITETRDRLIEWIRFANYQSKNPLPDVVPPRLSLYRGFNFAKHRRQNGLYWATDVRLAWEAIDWPGDVESFPEYHRSGRRKGLPKQGIIHTEVDRADILWWVPEVHDSFEYGVPNLTFGIGEVVVDVHPECWRRLIDSEVIEAQLKHDVF
jgi:hypothetical protein